MTLIKPIRGVPLLILTLLLLAAGAFVWFQHEGKPWRRGVHAIPGLEGEVTVRWDAWGVPHVTAEHELDLPRVLGWLHANDRMTQMELGRRAASGRLAEVSGEAGVEIDVYLATLRLRPTAEAMYAAMSDTSRAWLDAYAQGVDAWLAERGGRKPPDLRLLGDVEPWSPVDSLLFALLMCEDLSFWNQRPEEERFEWLRAFGPERTRELLLDPHAHVPEAIAAMADGREPPEPRLPVEEVEEDEPVAPGSNNWAVGPSRAAGGQAMLANDPHLGLFLPAVWYQVLLRAPGYEAAGMTLPGLPGVVIGRGPHVAWAFTNVMLDDHDLFFERLDESGEHYWRDGEWRPIEVETRTIRVRDGEPRQLVLRRTDLGPLLDADPERGLPARSLAWTAHVPGDPLLAFRGLAMATTPDELLAAIEPHVAPAQNLVAAFDSGELLYTVLGKVPQRRAGDGRLPSPGWDPAYGWDGLRPRDTYPTVRQPGDDLLVTANADIFPPGFEHERFAADFFPPFRAERIRERLIDDNPWNADGFAELHTDNLSHFARRVVDALAADAPFDGEAGRAYDALASWDRRMDLAGPSALFALLRRQLLDQIFADERRRAGLEQPVGHRDTLLAVLEGELPARWFDDVATPEVEDRRSVVAGALTTAWNEAVARWGDDPSSWQYGELLTLTLRHRLDAVPVLGAWMRRGPFPVAGSPTTVFAMGGRWIDDGARMTVTYGPSMRWIVDWSRPETAWAVLPGGQSGHPADAHYDDQLPLYLAGEVHEAPWSEEAVAAATVSRTTLVP